MNQSAGAGAGHTRRFSADEKVRGCLSLRHVTLACLFFDALECEITACGLFLSGIKVFALPGTYTKIHQKSSICL